MRRRPGPRTVLAGCSVVLIATVVTTGVALGPDHLYAWLLLSAGLAVVTGVQSAASDATDLTPALLFSMPPTIALIADGSPAWLIGPLAVLLLVAGELNALSWDCRGSDAMSVVARRRLMNIAPLALLGLAASTVIGLVGSAPSPGGIAAVLIAATALAALGGIVFRRAA